MTVLSLDEAWFSEISLEEAVKSLVVCDARAPDFPIVYASRAFEAQTGYRACEVIGRNCRFLQGPGTDPEAKHEIARWLAACQAFRLPILNYRKNGSQFWNLLDVRPLFSRSRPRTITHFLGIQQPIKPDRAGPIPKSC